ncbi:MAG: ATP synthase F1 subunit epsilon [Candidatus Kapabacteria bacterium]|nr:ATP synthase F1 subunit epsilon [Candidatus Kapabacteria bacterium]
MADHLLSVSIVTPRTTAFVGTAVAVSVPGSQSPFQVLYNHAPIISSLDIGVLKIQDEANNVSFFATREGFVEVLKNVVNIVVQDIQPASEVDEVRAQNDLEVAKQKADSDPDRAARDVAHKERHWAEARLRAARLQKETA